MIDIYRLTPVGEQLAHSYRYPSTPEWGIIHYLGKYGAKPKDTILANVPNATTGTLIKLRIRKIITSTEGVTV